MRKQIIYGIVTVLGIFLFMRRANANKNFVPDWTFQGSSIGTWRTLGDADWRAETGEIVGTPRTATGGWLILDKPLQDVQFASTFRCTGGCPTGVMVRAQSTPEGIQGVYVALPDGQNPAATFALKLDPQGREVKREPLEPRQRHRSIHRAATDRRRGGPGSGQRSRAHGAGFGAMGAALPPDSPWTRPKYTYRPNETVADGHRPVADNARPAADEHAVADRDDGIVVGDVAGHRPRRQRAVRTDDDVAADRGCTARRRARPSGRGPRSPPERAEASGPAALRSDRRLPPWYQR